MLDCPACFWRFIRAVYNETPYKPVLVRGQQFVPSRSVLIASPSYSVRQKSTAAFRGTAIQAEDVCHYLRPQRSLQSLRQVRDLRTDAVKTPDWNPGAEDGPPSAFTKGLHGHVSRELPWLRDPLKLSDRTAALLKQGKEEKALALVRLASKTAQCQISWNAIISYYLERQNLSVAWAIFNEMKKRAQFPDSYTYTILLSGLAKHTHMTTAVQKAVLIYRSMSGPTSRVQPNIIHTNAALRVCARANDMNSLWSIAGSIPEDGPLSANSVTYTTILNAMRNHADSSGKHMTEVQHEAVQESTVSQARQIWEDVISRWTKGELEVDEDLVCAMGRILLSSTRQRDVDDVLSLIEQTMNIRRQAPTVRGGNDMDFQRHRSIFSVVKPEEQPDEQEDTNSEDDFDWGSQSQSQRRSERWDSSSLPLAYAKPSNNTLSILVDACHRLMLKRAATAYWDMLTNPSGPAVKPDTDNFHTYLRILRKYKASAEAVELVRDKMKDIPPMAKTYRIAMSTCGRNQMSPNIMEEAGQLMHLMIVRMREVDIKTCLMWMQLGMRSPRVEDTLTAVKRLRPQDLSTRKILHLETNHSDKETKTLAIELLRLLQSGIDRVMEANILDPQEKARIGNWKSRYASQLSSLTKNEGTRENRLEGESRGLLQAKKIERFARKKEWGRARERKGVVLASMKIGRSRGKGESSRATSLLEHEAFF